ncbi:MAG: pyridoxamine 5'-phosphate oxidase family protein [Dehalococcoidia bacterium]|nr:MAG: pyridoxamine 5'-phosphate oxidase family protein [Dehalococcoidia bacterium]
MAKITEQMKEMVKGQQAFVATATPDGIPSVAPKGSTRILDDEHIIFAEAAGKRTFENIKMNPKVAIIIGDLSQMQCLRFSGTAEIITEGPLFDKNAERMKKMGAPAPQAVIKVRVEEIYDCGAPGFGKRLD